MLTGLRSWIRHYILGKNPICTECGAPMMKSGYPKMGVQHYKCRLRTFTGWCCEVEGCEETAVTGKGFCPEHLVDRGG